MGKSNPCIWTVNGDDRALATVICVLAEWIDGSGLEVNGDSEYCPTPTIPPLPHGMGDSGLEARDA